MKNPISIILIILWISIGMVQAQEITYVSKFPNENHPEIGYWFISPKLISDEKKIVANIDSIADKCNYTMLFLTSREGANFYDFSLLHPVFQKLVAEGHKKGLKVGLQLGEITRINRSKDHNG
jgi:hypothetical protein